MTTAVLSKPYWRWRRYRKARGLDRRPGAIAKPWNGLILIPILVGLDQYTKAQLVTNDWAWHNQPATWLLYPIIATIVAIPFLLVRRVRLAAVFTLSGALGNMTSELRFDTIANPVQVQTSEGTLAFNVADVCLYAGMTLAAYAVLTAIIDLRPRRQI